jgi:hypothetical protein
MPRVSINPVNNLGPLFENRENIRAVSPKVDKV